MNVEIQKINQTVVTIDFIQDLSNEMDNITPLISSLKKFRGIIREAGYNKKFTKKEKELWEEIFTELLPEETEEKKEQ